MRRLIDTIEPWDRGERRAFFRLIGRVAATLAILWLAAVACQRFATSPAIVDRLPRLKLGRR